MKSITASTQPSRALGRSIPDFYYTDLAESDSTKELQP